MIDHVTPRVQEFGAGQPTKCLPQINNSDCFLKQFFHKNVNFNKQIAFISILFSFYQITNVKKTKRLKFTTREKINKVKHPSPNLPVRSVAISYNVKISFVK